MAFGRWLAAFVIVLPFAWPHLCREWRTIRAYFAEITILSLIGAGGFNALSYAGVARSTAINATLLNAMVPFFIMGLSWLFLRERMRAAQCVGLVISFAGAVWIIGAGDVERLAALRFNSGDLLICLAMVAWAGYTIIIKRRPVPIHPLSFVAVLAAVAVVTLMPLAWQEARISPVNPGPALFAGIAYIGIGPSILGFVFWHRGVAAIGAARTGLFLYLIPVFGSMLSSLFLHEHLMDYHWAGFAMVLGGLLVGNRTRA